jgi:carboxylesterase type B
MESGAPSPVGLLGVDVGPLKVVDLLNITNCKKEDRASSLKCLQDMDVAHLKDAQKKLMIAKNTNAIIPSPDGDFIPGNPFKFFMQDNAFARNHKEIIIGINGDEGAMFISPMLPRLFPERSAKINQSLNWDVLEQNLRIHFKPKEAELQTFLSIIKDDNISNTPEAVGQVLSDVVGQLVFKCAAFGLTTNFTKSPERKAYLYQFDPRPKNSLLYPWAKKAIHMDEIPFVFGTPFVEKDQFIDRERQLSKTIMTYWSNFAKTGIPIGDILWKPCEGKNIRYMWFRDLDNHEIQEGLPQNMCNDLLPLFPVKR